MSGDIRLSMEDAGKTVRVPAGAVVELRLDENPTTGYRWTLPPETCCEMVEDRNEPQAGEDGREETGREETGREETGRDPAGREAAAAAGAASVRVLSFRFKGGAPARLALELRRAWEEGEPPLARFDIELAPQ